MNLVVVSGLSGSGKSTALHTLEDLGYFCIDNLPVGLIEAFANHMAGSREARSGHVAVGIDARSQPEDLRGFPDIVDRLEQRGIRAQILFLQADEHVLMNRFSETRRKHPLSGSGVSLEDAIKREKEFLTPISARADMFVDTTQTNVHQLRDLIRERVAGRAEQTMSLLFQSFGYKHGIPNDADFVFDVRCLPNPHWEPHLRHLTGRESEVTEFLDREPAVERMLEHLTGFLEAWIPAFQADNRAYMSVAVGCTGGQHRSVYLVERLARHFREHTANVITRHRELS